MKPEFQVAIIGAGFGGLCAAIRLSQSGRNNFVVFEKAMEVGGTWRDNTYPGCACDIPSHLYSFSFAPNPNWSRSYSGHQEIWDYLKNCVKQFDIGSKVRYNAEIVSSVFDSEKGFWTLTDQNGNSTSARVVISATGPLNRPNIPKIKGLENFKGRVFHSSEWDHSYDLTGKRVAVIGTGASAIQIVPNIAGMVQQLDVYQRSAAWVMPRRDRAFGGFEKFLLSYFPGYRFLYREGIYWVNEFFGLQFTGNKTLNKLATFVGKMQIKKSVKNPELVKKLTPDYTFGCKRVLVSDDYFPTFNRSNVELITNGIKEIGADYIEDVSRRQRKVDALVLSTGFVAAEVMLDNKIIGLDKQDLLESWNKSGGPEAFYGMSVSGYPNFMFLLGPNTGLGHNTVVHIMESQMNYVLSYIELLEKSGENSFFDLKPEVQTRFNKQLQEELKTTVWASGCKSWYMTNAGKNTTLWSKLTVSYRRETKRALKENYRVLG